MKKRIAFSLLVFLVLSAFVSKEQSTFVAKNGKVLLAFDLVLGKMEASNQNTLSTIDVKSDAVSFNISVNSFNFSNPILEKQFKEVYMEVDKYPHTTFTGKIVEKIDFKSTKTQKVTVDGVLGMHGVNKKRMIPALVTVQKDKIRVNSDFLVKASDHNIAIPAGFFSNGKDEISVKLDVDYIKK